MNLANVPTKRDLMDSSIKKALKVAAGMKKTRDKERQVKNKESKKVAIMGKELSAKLHAVSVLFPNLEEMHKFHLELLSSFVDLDSLKQALAHLEKSSNLLKKLMVETIRKIFRHDDKEKIISERKRFFARADSIVSNAEASLSIVREAVINARRLPKLKLECLTVILAGFPNTGKTTILSRLTTSRPKIAPYPFTTQGVKFGYFSYKYHDIQVVDTPGLLDREMSKRNDVEKRAIAALRHLGEVIVFVVDPTEMCGYQLKEQMNLLKEVRKIFKQKVIVVFNKADIATEKEMENVRKETEGIISGEGIDSDLGEILGKEAVENFKGK
ncbi:MAG: GTPase [Candidatus Diapherotrites archaeon]